MGRDFTASRPDEKWVADITYIATDEGWLYLAIVMDLFSRAIVGRSMADTLEAKIVTDALAMAISRRHPRTPRCPPPRPASLAPRPRR